MNNNITSILTLILTLSGPLVTHALCLKNCQQQSPSMSQSPQFNSFGYTSNQPQFRERSHNTRDVTNSVMGDMNIRVGHDKLDIKIDSQSNNNTVNASVSSTIILGNMKQ